MTTPTTLPLDALNELIAERQRYEGWLRALEERGDSVPAHILARVRQDYEGRLQDVMARLGEHAAELRTAIEGFAQRLAELEGALREREEQRLEGELRNAVGEYTAAQWDDLRTRLDAEIGSLTAERNDLESRLGELRAIYDQAVPSVDQFAPADGAPGVVRADAAPSGAEPAPVPRNVVSVREAGAPAAPAEPEPDPLGALGFLAPRDGAQGAPAGAAPSSATQEAPVAGEGTKTLRCQECGAMNYPTEWYCERCGGELAAI